MEIKAARKTATKYVESHVMESLARRPAKDAKVMVRYPRKNGALILAPDQDTLVEKLAKKIQANARKSAH